MAYWHGALDGAPALLELPTDRPRTVMSRRGAEHSFILLPELAESVRALGRRTGATLFMALLAAWDAVLARWSGQDDVVVGTPVAGRTRRETEGLIGLFVNTLALRTDLSGDPTFLSLLERVRTATLGAFANQDLPFEKLVEELQPERNLGYTPVFQVIFNLQNTGEAVTATPPTLTPAAVTGRGAPDAKVDVTLTVTEYPDGALHAALGYASDLFDAPTIQRLATQWARTLAGWPPPGRTCRSRPSTCCRTRSVRPWRIGTAPLATFPPGRCWRCSMDGWRARRTRPRWHSRASG